MKHSVFMTTAYGFAVLLISVIILGMPLRKRRITPIVMRKNKTFFAKPI